MQVGPRLSFSTAWAANAQSICQSCGLDKVTRIETSRRYLLRSHSQLSSADVAAFSAMVQLTDLPHTAFNCSLKVVRLQDAGQCVAPLLHPIEP